MLDKNMTLCWTEVEHDLYEENGYTFGAELDLFNGHEIYYAKWKDENGNIAYRNLSDDIYEAIDEFNTILKKGC